MQFSRKEPKERVCSICGVSHKARRKVCLSCTSRKYRADHPVRYVWNTVKDNAKRRGHEFAITLDWFMNFVKESGYMDGKGKTAESLSLDRLDPTKGYVPGNLRVITLAENTRRHAEYLAELNKLHPPYQEIEVPF